MMAVVIGVFVAMLLLIYRAFPSSGPRYAQSFYRWTRLSLAWSLVGWLIIFVSVLSLWEQERRLVRQEVAWMLLREEVFRETMRARIARLEAQTHAHTHWWRR